jgi:hypothetical protein
MFNYNETLALATFIIGHCRSWPQFYRIGKVINIYLFIYISSSVDLAICLVSYPPGEFEFKGAITYLLQNKILNKVKKHYILMFIV